MGYIKKYTECPQCVEQGRDSSGDNLVIYDDGNGYCHSCEYVYIDPSNKESNRQEKEYKKKEKELEKITKVITEEQKQAVKSLTSFREYRGIRADTAKAFGVRYETNEETGEISRQYYPVTKEGELVGYKVRKHPKDFVAPVGYAGKLSDLGGQFKFKVTSRDVIIVAGEIDQLSTYQMLRDDQVRRGKEMYEPVAVVTPICGEGSAFRQCQLQYAFLNKFQRIIVCLDNDEAGKEATEKLIKVLPKGKVFLMDMALKDPNKYLEDGKEREFLQCYWNARQYVPAGIVSSTSLYDRMIAAASLPKIPLPPFLSKLQKMMAGGIPLKYIVTLNAGSGSAKTTIANECIYYWLFNSPYKPGVVTCELDAEQYAEALFSRHIQKKLALIEKPEDKVAFLETEEARAAGHELFFKEDGSERFALMEDRSGTLDQLKEVIEEMIVSCGCSLLVIDPVQDIIGDLSNEEQGKFMSWLKGLIKSHAVSVILISHIRKKQTTQEGLVMPSEDDIHGSSTIIKSSGCNIMMGRDKEAEDPVRS